MRHADKIYVDGQLMTYLQVFIIKNFWVGLKASRRHTPGSVLYKLISRGAVYSVIDGKREISNFLLAHLYVIDFISQCLDPGPCHSAAPILPHC